MMHFFSKIRVMAIVRVVLGSVFLVVAAFGRNPDPKLGMKTFWAKGCIHCHSVLGEGKRIGPDLSRTPSTASGMELAAAMWNHAPQMWQRIQQEHFRLPTFELEDMEDLFAFLSMARAFDEPGNAEAGRQLFQSKRCVECHSIRGQGSRVGPDLATVASHRNPVSWVAAMWNHAPGMFQALAQREMPFPRFQGTEMVDLQSYIRLSAGSGSLQRMYLHPPSAERGAALFTSKQCTRCHRINGEGGNIGPDLSRVALPRRYGEIAMVMWNHAPQMNRLVASQAVPYPYFEPQELADVLAYLNSLPILWSGNPEAGKATFMAKGCSGCHSITSEGASIGPNLTRIESPLTPQSIARVMWNHGPAMLQRMESASIPWPEFNSRELADTLTFLEGIQTRRAAEARPQSSGGTP